MTTPGNPSQACGCRPCPGLPHVLITPLASIGEAITDDQGWYDLQTSGGYATALHARSPDWHFVGGRSVPRVAAGRVDLRLEVRGPVRVTAKSWHYFPEQERPAALAGAAIRKVIEDLARSPGQSPESLEEYARRGVISGGEFKAFRDHPEWFSGSAPPNEFLWGRTVLHYDDVASPLRLEPLR